MFEVLEICGVPGISGCINSGQRVIDGHYPHVMPHNSSLSFWEKGMTSDMGTTFLIGHHQLGNSREMAWERTSQHLGSARHPNSALYAQFRREGKEKQWGSF